MGARRLYHLEPTTSGKSWGRGPTDSDIHGTHMREADSPAWRHMKMLASLIGDDDRTRRSTASTPTSNWLTPAETERLQKEQV